MPTTSLLHILKGSVQLQLVSHSLLTEFLQMACNTEPSAAKWSQGTNPMRMSDNPRRLGVKVQQHSTSYLHIHYQNIFARKSVFQYPDSLLLLNAFNNVNGLLGNCIRILRSNIFNIDTTLCTANEDGTLKRAKLFRMYF